MENGRLSSRRHRILRIGSRIVVGVVAALIFCLLFVALFDWNLARNALARLTSGRLHREVHIDGPLRVHVFSMAPSVDVSGLRVGNPDWLPAGDMLEVGHLRLALDLAQLLRFRVVLDRLEVAQARMNLVQDEKARANWQLEPGARSDSTGARLPATRHFTVVDGQINLVDQVHGLRFQGQMTATENHSEGAPEPFQLRGDGMFNGEAFHLVYSGAALVNLRVDEPYSFHATVEAGATHVDLSGRLQTPFDLGHFDAALHATGRNLADLYYLTGLALPRTAPYDLSLQVGRNATHIDLRDIVGKMGASDVHGNAAVDLNGVRPRLTANIGSQSLRLVDLGIAFGAESGGNGHADFLLPRTPFELSHLQQMDAEVRFRATTVQAAKVPVQQVSIDVKLQDGVLKLEPVVLTLPQGTVSGHIRIDSGSRPAAVSLDLRVAGVELDQFKRKGATEAPLKGTLQAHATLAGYGSSVHDVAASGDGRISVVIPGGEIRESLAEFTGIDVLHGLGLLLAGREHNVALRCGIAEFNIAHGTAEAVRIVVDTQHVLVEGSGRFEFGGESLHLDISGKPKAWRLVRVRAPINVRGTFEKPSVGVEARSVAAQGGVAGALSALTPIAAILAFIDPGLAKDQNCAALEAEVDTGK